MLSLGRGYYQDDDVSLSDLLKRERIEGVQVLQLGTDGFPLCQSVHLIGAPIHLIGAAVDTEGALDLGTDGF